VAWPGIAVAEDVFVEFVSSRITPDLTLAELHVGDLYLACGCVRGDTAALAAFERTFGPVIGQAVTRAGVTADEARDLRQIVLTRLLVGTARDTADELPRLATYSGRGSLAAWIRVVATREAARLYARVRPELESDDVFADLATPGGDPELQYLKRVYRGEFKRSLEAAIAQLTDRQRLLLRQHTLDGLTIDALARFYDVHRATSARWLEDAREALFDTIRRDLMTRLDLSRPELESVLRLIRNTIEVSLPRLLRSA